MGSINVLADNVINKISAGEVIERPCSVIKELVENSIDAGAMKVVIEIKRSGRRLIRVTDDGIGMDRDDAVKSIQRHATSKISEIDDIWEVASFGFRGEALASIAAVSETELVTKMKEDQFGTLVRTKAGRIIESREAGCPGGTSVTVENLFSNTPVRLKFLKSDQTEKGKVLDIITTIAMANTRTGFSLIEEGREILHFPPADSFLTKVSVIFGKQFSDQLIPFELERSGIRVHGLLGKPEVSGTTRSKQYFFVNRRPIKSPGLGFSLSEGYKEVLPQKRYPAAFVFIDIDPQKVDVNIHPAKREVRFSDMKFIQGLIVSAVRDALRKHDLSPSVEYKEKELPADYKARVEEALTTYLDKPREEKDFSSFQGVSSQKTMKNTEINIPLHCRTS